MIYKGIRMEESKDVCVLNAAIKWLAEMRCCLRAFAIIPGLKLDLGFLIVIIK